MSTTEERYEGHSISVDNEGELVLTVDGDEIEIQTDDHGPRTLYTHRDVFATFEEPVELAKLLIDEEVVP